MKVPTHLKHKPVFGIENYNKADGIYIGESDTPCLSIGIAQWNQRGSQDISVKAWRNSGSESNDYEDGKWSRMSEELPIHRNIDLTIFICEVMELLKSNGLNKSINIQGESLDIRKIDENEFVDEDIIVLKRALLESEEAEIVEDRLTKLADILRRLGY